MSSYFQLQHPFQCITTLHTRYFVAACGPTLTVLDLGNYQLLSRWRSKPTATAEVVDLTEDEPPAKRQKGKDTAATPSQPTEQAQEQPPAKKQKLEPKAPNVIKLVVAPNREHVVAITDDKCVHVFQVWQGRLLEISQRVMPKRPCAVQIPDSETILIADKFGDVYSLPLITTPADSGTCDIATGFTALPKYQPPQTPFKPSADLTTIHSKRNREVLAAQLKQKNFTKKKEPLQFEHKVLLGHTSMLTDMKYMRELKAPNKGYIVTADRDEHIRVSRGPQPWVIEGFCRGHKEFISKICQVGGSPLMVSGGGDDWLGIWDWRTYTLLGKVDIREIVPHVGQKLTVAGIWSVICRTGALQEPIVVVTLERVPTLIIGYHETLGRGNADDAKDSPIKFKAVALKHNPIDVAWAHEGEGYNLIVSLDNRKAGGDKFGFFRISRRTTGLGAVHIEGRAFEKDVLAETLYKELPSASVDESDAAHKEVDALMYGFSSLRKQRDQTNEEVDAEAEANDQGFLVPKKPNPVNRAGNGIPKPPERQVPNHTAPPVNHGPAPAG